MTNHLASSVDVCAAYRSQDDNYEVFFASLDELIAETVEPLSDVLAEAVASAMGLRWRRRDEVHGPSVEVCLERPRSRGLISRVFHRGFVRPGHSYVLVRRDYCSWPFPFWPMLHEYMR
jgi:hypothetical protein